MASIASSTSPTSPTQPSSASITTTTSTQQASTSSPPLPSTASSVSSPQFPPPHHHAAHHAHHPAHLPPHGPGTGPPPSASAGAASASSRLPPLHSPHLPSASSQRQVDEARSAVVASISNLLDGELQSRAALLHSNNAAIEKQFRDVEKALAGLRKEDDKLAKVAKDAAHKVKELGNVQNWAELLEKDFVQLEETMRLVREGSEGSGSGSWSGESDGEGSGSCAGSCDGSCCASEAERREGDGDVEMEDGGGEGRHAELGPLDKGKGKEVVGVDKMDVDVPQTVTSEANKSVAETSPSHVADEAGKEPVTAPMLTTSST